MNQARQATRAASPSGDLSCFAGGRLVFEISSYEMGGFQLNGFLVVRGGFTFSHD